MHKPSSSPDIAPLLAWYDAHVRRLPWRTQGKTHPQAYHVWLSEIMLQQTTVVTVAPYFEKFLTLFPTLADLAAANDEAVMAAWAGLGYYSRARNLLACAREVMATHGGRFPNNEAALLALPGIGPYTAAAVAAIAYGLPTAPVDGNIERVLARIYADTTPLPALKSVIRRHMETLVPRTRPGDFAQSLMDLGALICTPKRPDCPRCPWQNACQAQAQGIAETLPRRAPKKPKPERHGTIYWLENPRGQVLMVRRPDKGLLGGMLTFPSTGWDAPNDDRLEKSQSLHDGWQPLAGEVVHVFTHFRLTLKVRARTTPKGFRKPRKYRWVHKRDLAQQALPSVMRKVARHVLG